MDGIFDISWLQAIVASLILTHITIIAVTLYLHRAMSHRAIDLHPLLAHFFRFWLWLTTGMKTKEWVAVHRKHHVEVDTINDPHSPVVHGLWKVLFLGVWLYRRGAKERGVLEKFGAGCPDDWLERHIYRHWNLGVLLMAVIDVLLWGNKGAVIWVIQMLWIPLTAAGIINGIGHAIGYRNFEPKDASRNMLPWGLLIGGEELHNNHHAYPRSACLSARSFEFDLGYFYIKILHSLGLCHIRYLMPTCDQKEKGLRSILNARMHICREFSHQVMTHMISDCLISQDLGRILNISKIKYLALRHPGLLKSAEQMMLEKALLLDTRLNQVYALRKKLYDIFFSSQYHDRLSAIQSWCRAAKSTNEESLNRFVEWLEVTFLEPEL
jgi:stearoyl-CoA desaturase (delta-9 desaturase)